MENRYLFLLWNKALFKEKEIVEDINNSFNINKIFYINWNKENYDTNLKSLYGHRLGSPIEKIIPCGKDKFLFILVEDKNPKYEEVKLYDGVATINKNIYDKKQLYRRWTAGSNRIHCSNSKEEINHDLVVLFGSKYEEIINSINNYDTINLDTKTIQGFKDLDDIKKCLKLFGNNRIIEKDNKIYILSYCRKDIEYFLGEDTIKRYNITVLGQLENDIPDYLNTDEKDLINYKHNNISTDRKSNLSVYLNIIKNEIKYIISKYL